MELSEILPSYDFLVPPQNEGAVVILLYNKIERKEIDQYFSYHDFQQTIFEVSSLEPGHQPHTERILKNLLHYFIERPSEKRERYKLTEYAFNFVKLLKNKLDNPYRYFPLKDSFKRYTLFKSSEITSILHFESWFEQGFSLTTKQTIIDHLEALKDDVDVSIKKINQVLYTPDQEILRTVSEFQIAFKGFGEKAEEIRDAIRLGVSVEQEINKIVKGFYLKIEVAKHPESEEELANYVKLEKDYHRSSNIQIKVNEFFGVVDGKLGQLKDRILFSSTKLTELHDNFKYQSRFKINLKRFLGFTLEQCIYTKDGPTLPKEFPRKLLLAAFEKFNIVPFYDFQSTARNRLISAPRDEKYLKQEKLKIDKELERLERTLRWVNKLKQQLKDTHELDFTPHFYEILKTEGDIEISMHVGYEIFQFANGSKSKYLVRIDKEILEEFKNQPIATWKMKINRKG